MAGTELEMNTFVTPLVRHQSAMGEWAKLTITFSKTHAGYTKERAEEIAALVGGTIEPLSSNMSGEVAQDAE